MKALSRWPLPMIPVVALIVWSWISIFSVILN